MGIFLLLWPLLVLRRNQRPLSLFTWIILAATAMNSAPLQQPYLMVKLISPARRCRRTSLRNPCRALSAATNNGFVCKLNATGTEMVWCVLIGGDSATRPNAIAADADGNVYVTGRTGARNFPLKNPVQDSIPDSTSRF